MSKSKWQLFLERRTANIGFLSRLNAFRDPTPAEKAAALAIEKESWKNSKGYKPYTVGSEYSVAKYTAETLGTNLKQDPSWYEKRRERAIKAYLETPMDPQGVLASLGIDVSPYERGNWFKRLVNWFKRKFGVVEENKSYAEKVKLIEELKEKK